MTVSAGELNLRVTILEAAGTQGANGELSQEWATYASVWASVRDITGREFVEGGGLQSEVTTKMVMRFQAGVEPAMRAECGDDLWEIVAVLRHGDKRHMTLMCKRLA